MSHQPLPVPAPEETIDRFLSAARPLLDDRQMRQADSAAQVFLGGDGPRLQAELEGFAQDRAEAGSSWLARAWLEGYLRTRDSLPLSTSVGFQLADEPGTPGLDRAARFIHRAAAVHLQQLRGETPVEVSPRGAQMCMQQWEALCGGLRHPLPGMDEIRRPEIAAADAEIGIVHRGRMRVVPIADDRGRPRSVAWIAQALRTIVGTPATPSAPSAEGQDGPPFGAVSWLPADEAAELLEEMLRDDANAQTYERLTRLVLTVTLQEDAATSAEHEQRLAFGFEDAWVRKPLSYEIGLADGWTGVHVEHSTIDGATVLAAVHRMREHEIDDAPAADPDLAVAVDELVWAMSPEQVERVRTRLEAVRRSAEPLSVRIITVPRVAAEQRPFRMSDDAVQQLIFTIAQLSAFGRVRGVYESVDVREYQAGRTECLRPVTSQAVEFAAAALEGCATREQLRSAIDAHKDWIKACKSGRGPDRHLRGLRLMAGDSGAGEELFGSEALAAVSEDFLSTTSVGGPEAIVRYAFAPSAPGGFGIAYTKGEEEFEFCLSFRADSAEDPEGFAEALRRAAAVFWEAAAGMRDR
ncbi:choline/carnitine O-acyltransferase [Kocuria palustris]|uniref:choline/carnitine O-acyltransferase n=1 Tax=Kocuria palustris TaxID=71999 RepID=UPI0011A4A634|nr:choline/carnitine O-acyltransferase [Kocuria palustris]